MPSFKHNVMVSLGIFIGGAGYAQQSALDVENSALQQIREAAFTGDDDALQAGMEKQQHREAKKTSSLAALHRAITVCVELQNSEEHGKAMRVARKALAVSGKAKNEDSVQQAQRLFWEAWLYRDGLGDRVKARTLLLAAAELAPDDDQISTALLRLDRSIQENGR